VLLRISIEKRECEKKQKTECEKKREILFLPTDHESSSLNDLSKQNQFCLNIN